MYPVSNEFLLALAHNHQTYIRAQLLTKDDPIELDVLDGSVTFDGNAASRGALSLVLAPDETMVPDASSDPLAPYGNEIRAERGIRYSPESFETVPLGIFRLDETSIEDSGSDLGITVNAFDRSIRVIESVFEKSGQVQAGTNCLDQIKVFISQIFPDLTYDFVANTVTTPLLSYEAGDDRWDFCQGLAEAAGVDLYFDSNGILVARQLINETVPVYTVKEGEGGTLLSVEKAWGREGAYNRVTVSGESSTGDPVFAEAIDSDPGSPTYYYDADFGRLTFPYDSSFITTQPQADLVAGRILQQKLGTGQRIGFSALVNPALRPLDVIQIDRPRAGVQELHIIDSITIPLTDSGMMSVDTRVLRVF